jgi:CO/xanthine dehydrogenase Mo-binding subunit
MGMAQSLWGANVQTASSIEVRLHRDGSVEALSGVQDIGSGIGVVIAQTIAEVLGLTPDRITVRIGDLRVVIVDFRLFRRASSIVADNARRRRRFSGKSGHCIILLST